VSPETAIPRQRFYDFVGNAIVAFPQHLNAILRVLDDPELPDEGRVLLAGSIVHWLSRTNTLPGVSGLLSYVDDVLVIRLVLERIAVMAPEVIARQREHAPDLLGDLDGDMAIARGYMGPAMTLLEKALDRIGQLKHLGRTATQCARDEESTTMLYEEVQSALVDLEVEREAVMRALRDLDRVLDGIKRR
jgi:uncharacterized membrane protein YkvA (DUF1232 family)